MKRLLASGLAKLGLSGALLGLIGFPAFAQGAADYPSRPLTVVVAKAPGGIDDTVGRLLANYLQPVFGQPVVVENRPGAAGIVGTDLVIRANPDGYTVLVINLTGQITAGAQQQTPPYDPLTDFNPVSLVATYKNVLVSSAAIPARTLDEFIEYARGNPDTLAYATGGIGNLNHLAIEMLMEATGIDMVNVPYPSGGEAILALNSNLVQLYLTDVNTALNGYRMGNVNILGQAGSVPSPVLPDVPLMADALPALANERRVGIIAPPGVPRDVIEKLNGMINEALSNPELIERAAATGIMMQGSTVEEWGRIIADETEIWSPVAARFRSTN